MARNEPQRWVHQPRAGPTERSVLSLRWATPNDSMGSPAAFHRRPGLAPGPEGLIRDNHSGCWTRWMCSEVVLGSASAACSHSKDGRAVPSTETRAAETRVPCSSTPVPRTNWAGSSHSESADRPTPSRWPKSELPSSVGVFASCQLPAQRRESIRVTFSSNHYDSELRGVAGKSCPLRRCPRLWGKDCARTPSRGPEWAQPPVTGTISHSG